MLRSGITLVRHLRSVIRLQLPSCGISPSYQRLLSDLVSGCDPERCRSPTKYPSNVSEIKYFLQNYKVEAVAIKLEEFEPAVLSIWDEILEIGDIALVEKYLEVRINLGMIFSANNVLACLEKANMSPSERVFGAFIRQSCVAGDIKQAKSHLRSLRESRFIPSSHTFSHFLHGYVKAGLLNRLVSLQEKLSVIGLWPSRIGYEGILSAYADLGDKSNLMKTLDEALIVLQPVKTVETKQINSDVFPPSFIFDIYVKLVCSQKDPSATCCEILTKMPFSLSSNTFALDAVRILLAHGRLAAALEVFKMMDLKNIDNAYLISLLRFAVHGGLSEEDLEPFWKISARDESHLQTLVNKNFERNVPQQSGNFANEMKNLEGTTCSPRSLSDLEPLLSIHNVSDPVLHACALFRENLYLKRLFRVDDIEHIFWNVVKKNSLSDIPRSIKALIGLFLLTKDYDGFKKFFYRIASDLPENAHLFLNRNTVKALLTEHVQENWDFLESVLRSKFIPDGIACQCIRGMEDLRPMHPVLKDHVEPSWISELLLHRLQEHEYSKRSKSLHWIISSFCKSNSADIIYSLQQKVFEHGYLILPETMKSIIATPYLIQGNLLEHRHLCFRNHELTSHYPVNLNNKDNLDALKQLDSIIQISSTSSTEEIVDMTVNWLTNHIPCHLFKTPIDPLTCDIPTWLIICQRLLQEGSTFKEPTNWMYLALKWLEQTSNTPDFLDCFKDWFNYAPNKSTSTSLLIAGLIHPKSREWALSVLSERNDAIYDIIVSDSLYHLSDENQSSLAEIISGFGKTNTLAVALQLFKNGFEAPTLQYIISKWPGDEYINELVRLSVAKTSWITPMADFISEHYPDKKLTFYNNLLTVLRTNSYCQDTLILVYNFTHNSISQLDPINRWILDTISKLNNFSKVKLSSSDLRNVLSDTGLSSNVVSKDLCAAINNSKYQILVESLKSMDEKTLDIVVPFVIYFILINKGITELYQLLHFTSCINERKLLSMFCKYFQPFIKYNLKYCILSQGQYLFTHLRLILPERQYYDGDSLDWLSMTGMQFFELRALSIRQKSYLTMKTNEYSTELSPKMPVADVAQFLVDQKCDEYLGHTLELIGRLWDLSSRIILLHHLANLGSVSLFKRIFSSLPKQDREMFYPLKFVAYIIQIFSSSGNTGMQNAEDINFAIQSLTDLPSDQLATIICSPHMDTLFQCWPAKYIRSLITIVNKISENGNSSISSQLAGVLVNRGLYNDIGRLTKISKRIPPIFLAGSSQSPLTESSFLSTLEFMNTHDPEHISEFLDHCKRNAEIYSSHKQSNTLIEDNCR
ncbi:unnamed protein product [Schistosoma rodhaini]|uniref:Pentacotripeptide-repeat region of PRORP domain-containing protein n=1 Tax=Schistosoma rodhaini TaxID=6188 RepID=A0AA85ESW9_9TREM|nr:unnamed protein product [Schistosoma rodhaini]